MSIENLINRPLTIGDLKVPVPIIQGGMGVCVSLSGLASAVANEGGIGVISAVGIGMLEPDFKNNFKQSNKIALRKEIRKAYAKTNGIIGVNIMLAATDFDELLQVCLEEEIDVVFISAGLPLKKPLLPLLDNTKTKFIPKVSSARAAKLIFQHWSDKYDRIPDAIVLEGPLAGGHQGYKLKDVSNPKTTISALVNETKLVINPFEQKYGIEIPIIAAGGIYTGKDILEILEVGAQGVKMGSRFVTTTECDVSEKFKQVYIDSSEEDITVISSPVGLPARVIKNDFVEQIQQGMKKPINCPWKCLKTCDYKKVQFCIADAMFSAAIGEFSNGFAFAGTKSHLANKIITVKETFEQIKFEYFNEQLMYKTLHFA